MCSSEIGAIYTKTMVIRQDQRSQKQFHWKSKIWRRRSHWQNRLGVPWCIWHFLVKNILTSKLVLDFVKKVTKTNFLSNFWKFVIRSTARRKTPNSWDFVENNEKICLFCLLRIRILLSRWSILYCNILYV